MAAGLRLPIACCHGIYGRDFHKRLVPSMRNFSSNPAHKHFPSHLPRDLRKHGLAFKERFHEMSVIIISLAYKVTIPSAPPSAASHCAEAGFVLWKI